jgi:hypothetical protein
VTAIIKVLVYWIVTPYSFVGGYQHFEVHAASIFRVGTCKFRNKLASEFMHFNTEVVASMFLNDVNILTQKLSCVTTHKITILRNALLLENGGAFSY